MPIQTHWLPGVLVLLAGLIAGVLYVLLSRRGPADAAAAAGALDDFNEKYRLLLGQLKEMIADKHNMAPAAFEAEKSRLELAAAEVLKRRDELVRGEKHEAEKAT